jgi:hypothetical protein
MSLIKEHQRIVLTTDLPAEKLTVGDVGTVGLADRRTALMST